MSAAPRPSYTALERIIAQHQREHAAMLERIAADQREKEALRARIAQLESQPTAPVFVPIKRAEARGYLHLEQKDDDVANVCSGFVADIAMSALPLLADVAERWFDVR